jgi:hypothetical protein
MKGTNDDRRGGEEVEELREERRAEAKMRKEGFALEKSLGNELNQH